MNYSTFTIFNTCEYGRQCSVFRHFENLIPKWLGFNGKMTQIVNQISNYVFKSVSVNQFHVLYGFEYIYPQFMLLSL